MCGSIGYVTLLNSDIKIHLIGVATNVSIKNTNVFQWKTINVMMIQFSVPQIQYPLGGNSQKRSHVYFLLQVFWVKIIVWYKCRSDATVVTWCHNSTIWCHNSSTMANINRKYTWLPFLLLPPSVYFIWELIVVY